MVLMALMVMEETEVDVGAFQGQETVLRLFAEIDKALRSDKGDETGRWKDFKGRSTLIALLKQVVS